MEKTEKVISVYDLENDYVVETTLENDYVEFWLHKKGYGVKNYMFGVQKDYADSIRKIESLIKSNIDIYISIYKKEVID